MRSTLDVEGGRAQLRAGRTAPPQAGPSSNSSARAALSATATRTRPEAAEPTRLLPNVSARCDPEQVRVTDSDIARIPAANIRVPRGEFTALWTAAEQLCDDQDRRVVTDWYAGGVAATCEWLAAAVLRPDTGPPQAAYSPATGRSARAYEELIEAECVAAERLLARRPIPPTLLRRPGWIEGIVATLCWAWRRSEPPPLEIAERDTG